MQFYFYEKPVGWLFDLRFNEKKNKKKKLKPAFDYKRREDEEVEKASTSLPSKVYARGNF